VSFWLATGLAIWVYYENTRTKPKTQSPEWQAATDQKSIETQQNPFSGPYAQVVKAEKNY
jgi:hypothetical protein